VVRALGATSPSIRVCTVPISPVFDRIADTLVDSFVHRAEQVHGPR